MLINHAIRSLRVYCASRPFSLQTEKSYVHWLGRYGAFLKDRKLGELPSEKKMETFLTHLALSGVSASTQNQAFNALLCFYRDVLKQVRARAVAAEDRAQGVPVALPGLLAKKCPWAERAERWGWLFPSHTTCRDPRSGKQVRWRCHENNVQRAVRAAACRCKLEKSPLNRG